MSVLKKKFEEACLLIADYQADLEEVIIGKEIRGIIKDYYYCELEFENEIYYLGHPHQYARRLVRLLMASKHPHVRRWSHIAGLMVVAHRCRDMRSALPAPNEFFKTERERDLFDAISYAYHFPRRCSRVWCWYRSDADEVDCECGIHTVDHEFFIQRDSDAMQRGRRGGQ